jgi:hypothetical protein
MTQAIEKAVTTLIVLEDPLPLYPSDDGVVDSTRIFDPCFPGHKNTFSNAVRHVNLKFYGRPPKASPRTYAISKK